MSIVIPFGYQDHNHVFINGYAFQQCVARTVTKDTTLVRVSTWNIGISDHDGATVDDFVKDLCVAEKVFLLVGYNKLHEKNTEITTKLKTLFDRHKNLQIRRLEKLHMKIVSVEGKSTVTWAGSLNLVTPTLFDLMVKLDPTQSREVCKHFDRLWGFAPVLFNH